MILLSILGNVLLVLGMVLGVLLSALILIPYDYKFYGENLTQSQIKGTVSWLFGGLKLTFFQYSREHREMSLMILGLSRRINIRPESTKEQNQKDSEDGDKVQRSKSKGKASNKKPFDFHTYLKRDIIQKALAFVLKILKHCQPKHLSVYVRIGFDDPMYTGFLCALHSQYAWLLDKYDLRIEPVFDEEVLEGRFSIGGRIWLAYLILATLRFLITKPIRNILIANLKRKNKGGLQYVR